MLVNLMGSATQSGSTGVNASRAINGITYRAVLMGTAGNSITIALVAGGTAGSEVVTVTGTAISVSIESGVSTRTQVQTAINASAAALALITISSVTSGGTAATASSALALQSGASTTFTTTMKGMTMTQIDTGLYRLTLADPYKALLACNLSLQKATATDLITQIKSSDVTTAQVIDIRVMAGATPTDLASGDILFADVKLRNSSS